MPELMRSKWFLPGFSVLAGLILLGAAAIGGQAVAGAWMFGVMAVAALGILLGGRSETVRGLRGDGRDERFETLDLRATAYAGLALMVAVIVAFLNELAHGRSGAPYTWLGAVAGLAYLASVVYLRIRS
jgi:hypothetical protein